VGYARLELPAWFALQRARVLARAYVTVFRPVRGPVAKTRDGATARTCYDRAATPQHRLPASGRRAPEAATRLAQRSAARDPVPLTLALEAAQASRYDQAARSDSRVSHR
jgi:hypothetical protein